jgi:hypothetical protein
MMDEARSHPAKSYDLGEQQITQFIEMTGDLPHGLDFFGGEAPTKVNALKWLRTYTLHEFEGAVDRYVDKIRSAVLYGTQQAVNPTQVASWIYHATHEAEINWRLIARTEMIRANHMGRLDACKKMGFERVWVPPHVGSCSQCKRLIENKIFKIDEFRDGSNYGKPTREWVACIPLHPQCRHVAVAYVPSVYEDMQAQYKAAEDLGLTGRALDEMFESSGQLKPEYANDPRLAQLAEIQYKTYTAEDIASVDPYTLMLGSAVEKYRHDQDVAKGFFDNPEPGLDPLVWSGIKLRHDVRQRIIDWWHHTLGADAGDWSSIYLSGSVCTYMWGEKSAIGDLDLQIVVDYDKLRTAHKEYAKLTEEELHVALVTQTKLALGDFEVAPGLPLDAFIRPEDSPSLFAYNVRASNQPAYDLAANTWVTPPLPVPYSEDVVNEHILEGLGGEFAVEHPEWVQVAAQLADDLTAALRAYSPGEPPETRDRALAELQAAYTVLHDLRKQGYDEATGTYGIGNFIWQYVHQYGPLVEVKAILEATPLDKVFPHATIEKPSRWHIFKRAEVNHTAVGTEHWITIHPHGDDEKGIPVLVRENGDGTASIIGGAGHHLDHVRIGEKGRMDRKGAAKPPRQYDPGEVTEEMANTAREGKATAQQLLREARDRVEAHVQRLVEDRGALVAGEPVKWDDLSSADQHELIQRATHDSLYQSTYGNLSDANRSEAPVGPIVVTPAPRDKDDSPASSDDTPADDTDEDTEDSIYNEEPERSSRVRPRLALSTEDADSIYEELATASALRRRVREANKVLSGETRPEDSAGLDWSPIDAPAEAQRKAASEALTEINRELLNDVETARKRSNSLVSQAIQHGCFDAFDSLSYSVFGKTVLPTRLQALLGVNGTAQIMAHELRKATDAGDLDMDKLKSTIDDITDERQSAIMRLDLNRARFAAREAAAAGEELKASAKGESMFTLTAARSRQVRKMREAAQSLGMAVAGSEALHTLQTMLGKKIDTVRVEGFGSKALIMELAHKADVHVTPSMIEREGAGRYNLKLSAKQISSLLAPSEGHDPNAGLLHDIRTGEDMDAAIETASHPPGYSRTLDRAQAQGSLYLRAAGSGVLAFAPGVGKTDTAIGAALELMSQKPGTRVLIVAPATAVAGTWAKTIQQTCPGKSMTVLGRAGPGEGDDPATYDWEQSKGVGPKKRALQQPGDFNIVSFQTLAKNPELVKDLGHTIVITDEAQYYKNEDTQNYAGVMAAATPSAVEHRWALTGTPLEKNMGELHTLLNWAKPGHYGSKSAFSDRYGQLNQFDQLTGNERVQQFRESCADGAFFQAPNMSAMPPFPELDWVDAPLEEGHTAAITDAAQEFNEAWEERHRQKLSGVPNEDLPKLPSFGGRGAQMSALMKPQQRGYQGPNARVNKIADMIEGQKPTEFAGFKGHHTHQDGENAGTYAPKAVVFGAETQPLQPIREELERRGGRKVFYTQGGDAAANDRVLRDFIACKGAAVLITSDTNKTARSLQFGDNGGVFQNGATQMIHADMPQNNADLQQRIARIWRRGAQAPCSNRILYSDTPQERNGRDSLAAELRLQQSVGNPEDKVANRDESGKLVDRETIQQKLQEKGQGTVPRVGEEEAVKYSDSATFDVVKATELRIPKGGKSEGRIHPGEWTRAGGSDVERRDNDRAIRENTLYNLDTPEAKAATAARSLREQSVATWVHCYPYNPREGHAKHPRNDEDMPGYDVVDAAFEAEIKKVALGNAPTPELAPDEYQADDEIGTAYPEADQATGVRLAHTFMAQAAEYARPSYVPLHRGVRMAQADIDRLFVAGKKIDVPISSWTSSESTADMFGGMANSTVAAYNKKQKVILHVPPKTMAFELLGGNAGEHERVLAGEFEVKEVEHFVDYENQHGITHVYLNEKPAPDKDKPEGMSDDEYQQTKGNTDPGPVDAEASAKLKNKAWNDAEDKKAGYK